jgi:MtrB/PioB family decaheme-associated outer membrane protein
VWLLAALGVLWISAGGVARAADPAEWTCETCPFETGTSGAVEVGIGAVTNRAAKFGDYTGLDDKGAFGIVGGTLRHRGAGGFDADVSASDLGLDSRALSATAGQEGLYSLRLGYAEIPHRLTDTARTPFLGTGGAVLTLPPGFPAADTASMPLATTLHDIDLGFKRKRTDAGATLVGPGDWQFRVDAHRDVRDGLQRAAGSFFSTTSQLPAPVDQVTDRIEASAAYTGRRLQASLAWHSSTFRNGPDALTWQNPFTPVVPGATQGQIALAPDNEFHQVSATVGYDLSPTVRASGEIAMGRMTQDQALLAATLNPNLVVAPLPAASLHGRADTRDASLRLSAAPLERLRLVASVARHERDNKTPSLAWPTVSTDMFLGAATRVNLPYSFTHDQAKLSADWRGGRRWSLAAGIDHDTVHRTLQETNRTRDTTAWARGTARPLDNVTLTLKLSHGDRENSGYDVVAAVQPPENPLLRKFNQADRRRDAGSLRADATLGEGVAVGVNVELSKDDYTRSPIGLQAARGASVGADLSASITETTQVRAWAQAERTRFTQAGSQVFAKPDWTGRTEDAVDTAGVGVTHAALKGKLLLAADLTLSRARSDVLVRVGASGSPFPTLKTDLDTLRLSATWQFNEKLSLVGSAAHERYAATDWHLDGVLPDTVPNLLAFGEQPAHYHVTVFRVALRYRF